MMATNLPSGSNTGKMYKKPIKKNVGLRAFFPEMPSNMSNLEKAKIWVKRHNNNYFMGWTQEQLQNLDPIVRPLTIITPELYKRHMNRSEYCRIVKLKYCLESDADWAKDFRRRLGTDSSKGGFRSLGEAKLYATQLWRQYSELYDVHRARIGNSNSRSSLEKHHSLDGSARRGPKPIRLTSAGSSIPTSSASLLTMTGTDLHSLVSPYRHEDEKILSLHLPSRDDSHHSQLTEFPSSSSLNRSTVIKVEREDKYEMPSTVNTDVQSWPVDSNKVSSTHDMPVFPSVDQMELSILERVDVLLRRRRKDFFLGYTEDQLRSLSPYERPLTTVTEKEYQEYLFSDEGQLTSALATVFDLTEPWAFRFKKMLHLSAEDGGFSTWADVKQELYILLQNHLSGGSQFHDSSSTTMIDNTHGNLLSLDSDLPSTSGLVEKNPENFEYSTPNSSLIAGRDTIKDQTGSVYFNSGILNIKRLNSHKKSPDSSDRTVTSQASPSVPETTEDAITIDDDTNSEDNFTGAVHAPSNQSPSNPGKVGDELWVATGAGSADHRLDSSRLPFHPQMSDSNITITSSLDRNSLPTLPGFSSATTVISNPGRFSSPLNKVASRIPSLDMTIYGRNQVGLDITDCPSSSEPRNMSRIMSRYSSQSTVPAESSPGSSSRGAGESVTLKSLSRQSSVLSNSHRSTSKSFVAKLWTLRDKLAERCREDPAVSLHDKLRPHLKLIRNQLGETYTLPNTVEECMADLFLVTLEQELEKPSQTYLENNS